MLLTFIWVSENDWKLLGLKLQKIYPLQAQFLVDLWGFKKCNWFFQKNKGLKKPYNCHKFYSYISMNVYTDAQSSRINQCKNNVLTSLAFCTHVFSMLFGGKKTWGRKVTLCTLYSNNIVKSEQKGQGSYKWEVWYERSG